MKLKITIINVEPISLNSAFPTNFKTKRRFKSDDYSRFESIVNGQLRNYRSQINKFNKKYNENEHYLVSTYRFYYPILIKSGKRISKTSKDWSNLPKAIEDLVHKNLNADDSQVMSGSSTKIHSQDIRIEIEIELKNIKHIL